MLSDIEFGTNLNFAQRVKANPNPFQFEHHYSLYSYTIAIELDRVGEDENDKISLEAKEKAKRVNMLLEVLKILNRNIKGRIENLNPLFAVGGVYEVKNPFFLGRLKIEYDKDIKKYSINTGIIEDVLDMKFNEKSVEEDTFGGIVKNFWSNENELKEVFKDKLLSMNNFFEILKKRVSF